MSAYNVDLTEEKYLALLSAIKRAKNDNERFASLLMVSRLTKSVSLSDERRRELLKTIGIHFPTRLLSTACSQGSENEQSKAFAAIGSSILALFCADETLSQENGLKSALPHVVKIVEIFSKINGQQENEIVSDCLNCIKGLLWRGHGIDNVMKSGLLRVLCRLEKSTFQSEEIILLILSKYPESWNHPDFVNWLHEMASNFKNSQDLDKFKLCESLSGLLATQKHDLDITNFESSLQNIVEGLEEILCSKITSDQRKPALVLASEVLRCFGISRFIAHSKKDNFIVIVTRLACIEIGLFFKDKDTDGKEIEELKSLAACFFIAEIFCSAIAQFEQNESGTEDVLNFEQIRLTQPALADTANSISKYISEILSNEFLSISPTENLYLRSSVRMLGSWLNIENNVTSAQGVETLPIVPQMVKYATKTGDFNLLKATLPALMLASESSKTINIIMGCNILLTIQESLKELFGKLRPSFKDDELITVLHLTLQSLVSICTSDGFPSDISSYNEDLRSILETATAEIKCALPLKTKCYILPLLVTLLKRELKLDYAEYKMVVAEASEFLLSAHTISTNGRLEVSSEYKEVWSEISSLWVLCAHEITDLIQVNCEAKDVFVQSKWCNTLSEHIEAAKLNQDGEMVNILSRLSNLL